MILYSLIDIWDMSVPMAFNFDFVLMGIMLLVIILIALLWVRVKLGGLAIVFTGMVYLLSGIEPLFKPVFILMVVMTILIFIFSIKNKGK